MRLVSVMLATLAVTISVASAETTSTLSGKIVDVATYVTSDRNMDSMKMKQHGSVVSGSMNDDHTMGMGTKEECRTLGVLSQGRLTLLAAQIGSQMSSALCTALGRTATVSGRTYTRAGVTVFLVESIK